MIIVRELATYYRITGVSPMRWGAYFPMWALSIPISLQILVCFSEHFFHFSWQTSSWLPKRDFWCFVLVTKYEQMQHHIKQYYVICYPHCRKRGNVPQRKSIFRQLCQSPPVRLAHRSKLVFCFAYANPKSPSKLLFLFSFLFATLLSSLCSSHLFSSPLFVLFPLVLFSFFSSFTILQCNTIITGQYLTYSSSPP